jgi:nitrogen fixation NifU-like protein
MSSLYQAELLDHYRNPRNRGELVHADFSSGQYNPSCGDRVQFQGRFLTPAGLDQDVQTHDTQVQNTQDKLEAIAFTGVGCVISQATASLLSERVLGYSPAQILALDKNFITELIGMELGPTRLKCALLPLEALQQGVAQKSSLNPLPDLEAPSAALVKAGDSLTKPCVALCEAGAKIGRK